MNRKVVAIWMTLLMMLSLIVIVIKIAPFVSAQTTWYVDDIPGSGGPGDPPEDFTSIQDAIDAANPGDTVFVYNGTYYENVVVNKTINLTGENKNTTIIDGGGSGKVVRISQNWVNITGFTITGGGSSSFDAGIYSTKRNIRIINNNICLNSCPSIHFEWNSKNFIINNSIYYNWEGISLMDSDDNNIIGNNISSNGGNGINSDFSSRNNIEDNLISTNNRGIMIDNGINNNIKNNTISNHYWWEGMGLIASSYSNLTGNIFINDGIVIYGYILSHYNTHNISSDNIVNGKPICYYKNCNDINIDDKEVGQLILANCSNCSYKNLHINNTDYGIQVAFSSNISLLNNNVSNNWNGLSFWSSHDNDIINNNIINNSRDGIYSYLFSENNITKNNFSNNNWRGIYFVSSTKNKIYHNNFINNTIQAEDDRNNNFWDDGYPLGGNYWSNYIGNDTLKGPNQNVPGSDGIGDTNYSIDSDSIDNYPLMEPYPSKSLENYITLKHSWNLISIPIIHEEQNITRILGSIDGWYDAIQWYDNTENNDTWKHYKVGKPYGNDLFELNESMGFWIHITNPGDTIFFYNGTQPTSNQTIQLHSNWNMVGYPSLTSYNRTEGLNNLTFNDQIDAIWSYDAFAQKWEEMGESDYFQIGKGYYIHAKSECEWEVPL